MRILFINRLLAGECVGRVPLGILYLSPSLKDAGHHVALANAGSVADILRKIETFQPEVLAYSVRTGYHRSYARINRQVKEVHQNLFSVFGGNHPTFFPQMILKDPSIDAVCVGEAEDAMVDFIGHLETGGEYHQTPNFWVRRDGEVYQNPPRPLIDPLDRLPFPDRDLLEEWPVVRDFPVRNFITSRGCPYQCTYCFNYSYFNIIYKGLGKRVRRRSVENVVQEIEKENRSHPFQVAQFEDDVFVHDVTWLAEFAESYRRRIGKPFTCNVRVEIIDEEKARLLKEAGCVSVWLGVESGDETIRKEVLNRQNSDSTIRRGVGALQRAGIHVATENILGIPSTGIAHDFTTLRLNQALKPSFANPSLFQPYPQTPLGDRAREMGVFSGNYDDITDFYQGSCLKIKHAREVRNLQFLFAMAVEYPFLSRLLPALIKLPLGRVYKMIGLFWKGYALTRRVVPVRMSLRQSLGTLRRALATGDSVEF